MHAATHSGIVDTSSAAGGEGGSAGALRSGRSGCLCGRSACPSGPGSACGGEVKPLQAEDFAVGQPVRTLDSVRPARYAGRAGVVVSVNHRDREIGVAWGRAKADLARTAVYAWFRREELVANGAETLSTTSPSHAKSRRGLTDPKATTWLRKSPDGRRSIMTSRRSSPELARVAGRATRSEASS